MVNVFATKDSFLNSLNNTDLFVFVPQLILSQLLVHLVVLLTLLTVPL